MAAIPNHPALVSAEEYLSTSYRPEMEFVDGVLEERGMPTELHGLFQALLAAYFWVHRKQFRFAVSVASRTQIQADVRYRVPDIVLAPLPVEHGVVTRVPWAVVEIQSPDDRPGKMLRRFRDLESRGIRHIVWMDPEERIAARFENGALIETIFATLELPSGTLPFDSEALFQQLADELAQP